MDIKKEIEDNQIILLLIPNSEYSKILENILLSGIKFRKMGYICLNRPPSLIINKLNKDSADNICFLDCVSECQGGLKNCIFVSSKSDLLRISLSITKLLDGEKVDVILFDSLSTLLAYNSETLVIQFAQAIMNKLRAAGCKGIFPCPKDDIKVSLKQDLEMFADKTVSL